MYHLVRGTLVTSDTFGTWYSGINLNISAIYILKNSIENMCILHFRICGNVEELLFQNRFAVKVDAESGQLF